MRRIVSSWLTLDVASPSRIALQVAVAPLPGLSVVDELSVVSGDEPLVVRPLPSPHGGLAHVADVPAGLLSIRYSAEVEGTAEPAVFDEFDELRYLRASRYAESDRLYPLVRDEFAAAESPQGRSLALVDAVAEWVASRLFYLSGWSRPTDGAVDTLLSGQGVCRDFAHVVLASLRALDIPARAVAVYAPGLDPMDFHLVVEAWVDGAWHVVDATRLAPRQSMLRIATGRDAADTAFLSSYLGELTLLEQGVLAIVDGALPYETPDQSVILG